MRVCATVRASITEHEQCKNAKRLHIANMSNPVGSRVRSDAVAAHGASERRRGERRAGRRGKRARVDPQNILNRRGAIAIGALVAVKVLCEASGSKSELARGAIDPPPTTSDLEPNEASAFGKTGADVRAMILHEREA